jgi:hypothetical protein
MDFGIGIVNRVLNRPTEVRGELGCFGLGDWWLQTFTAAEQARLEAAYQQPGRPSGRKPLTKGNRSSAYQTAAGLLTAIAGQLRKSPEDRGLACRILTKAEDRALADDDILGLHFTYQELIRLHYTWREQFADALDLAFAACYKQTRIAPQAVKAFRDTYAGRVLPVHVGYELMAAILEKQGDCAQAIECCKQAQAEGWPGNWMWRIQRMARKLSGSVTSISSSGITPITQ